MIVYSNIDSNRIYFSGSNPNPNPPLNLHSSSLHFPIKFQNPIICHSQAQSQSFMALHLCKPKLRSLTNPSLIHLFSTSQNDNDDNNSSQSPLNSYFSDVKASLKNQHQNPQTPPFSGAPSKVASIEEIRKNLAEFRQRSAAPNPTEANPTAPQQSKQHLSFQELYKRNTNNDASKGKLSLEAIRESLRQMRSKNTNSDRNNVGTSAGSLSLSNFRDSLRLKPEVGNTNTVLGGTQELPKSVFGREMREEGKSGERDRMTTEFVKMYSYGELGDKLRKLRPGGSEGGFSLEELNGRLMRLREMEEKETESRIGGVSFKDLRDSLVKLKISDEEKSRKSATQRLDILGQLGATPNYMLYPPKENLVEKYFHPDNMSSAEKLKIALAKVREEFKMSESDCGSGRVQIAQLTTKIKHLSSVLHKKDKHSLKGLQAMVQRRKRLLKYLRRTDWDSYCFVLSKLGLRDNPDYKTLS